MQSLYEGVPPFWQGVLASIVAAIIIAIVGYILRISSKQLTESSATRKAQLDELKAKLRSTDSNDRLEASLLFMFKVLEDVLIGAMLMLIPEVLSFRSVGNLLRIPALIFFALALRQVFIYYQLKSPKLQIVNAIYGTDRSQVDATRQIAAKVRNNRLKIVVSNAIVGDPEPGTKKSLKITYMLDDELHEAEFEELEEAELP